VIVPKKCITKQNRRNTSPDAVVFAKSLGFCNIVRNQAWHAGKFDSQPHRRSARVRKDAKQPVIRVSKGHFEPGKYAEIAGLIADSAAPLVPALDALEGLLYYHASVDENTNTVVNVSVWKSEEAAKQMDKLAAMLAQRPILEAAGVTFDRIANYKPLWKIEKDWAYPERD